MKDKILIDTSAWICSFRKTGHGKLKQRVVEALTSLTAVTANIVILELLQGCINAKEYDVMQSRLAALELLNINDKVWEVAYEAGYQLRKKGITVPTVDIIISSLVKVHNCTLLHHDRHFKLVAGHLGIKTIDFLNE
jgi:predicted nucleic acid-binding protein